MKRILGLLCAGMIAAVSCKNNDNNTSAAAAASGAAVSTPVLNYTVVNVLPHDTASFTQGLVIHNGQMYESTGTYDNSWLGPVDMKTGKIDRKVVLAPQYFGEGMAILNNKIYQLTWTT
jgi:glutaminyl-peptide cyclotransferase